MQKKNSQRKKRREKKPLFLERGVLVVFKEYPELVDIRSTCRAHPTPRALFPRDVER